MQKVFPRNQFTTVANNSATVSVVPELSGWPGVGVLFCKETFMATQSFIDFRKFFTKRPQWMAFPLDTERKLAQGVCWFGDSDMLPSSRKALHEYLGASEEEIETMKTQGLGGKTLKEVNPALIRNSTISSQESHSANALELQTGIDLATQDIRYACSSQSQGIHAVDLGIFWDCGNTPTCVGNTSSVHRGPA